MSECPACGFNAEIKHIAEWNFILCMSAYSGNQIGGNEKGKRGWKYRKAKAEYRKELRCKMDHVTPAEGKRRLWVTRVYRKGKRPYDTDNLAWGLKPLVDIMVTEGILKDDSPKYLERIYKQVPSYDDNDSIHIRIDELDPGAHGEGDSPDESTS